MLEVLQFQPPLVYFRCITMADRFNGLKQERQGGLRCRIAERALRAILFGQLSIEQFGFAVFESIEVKTLNHSFSRKTQMMEHACTLTCC
jgi:hypothetical protein